MAVTSARVPLEQWNCEERSWRLDLLSLDVSVEQLEVDGVSDSSFKTDKVGRKVFWTKAVPERPDECSAIVSSARPKSRWFNPAALVFYGVVVTMLGNLIIGSWRDDSTDLERKVKTMEAALEKAQGDNRALKSLHQALLTANELSDQWPSE